MRGTFTFAFALFALTGCSGSPSDPGLGSLLRVANAQYYAGVTPSAQDGPAILSFNNTSNLIRAGQLSKPLSGIVSRDTTAIALFLDGDAGYWIVEPGAEDPTALSQLGFSAKLSFSPSLAPGSYTLEGRAVNALGQFGPPSTATLSAMPQAPSGTLVITLRWVQDADLDLHVVDPNGFEIWAKNINSAPPPVPGQPSDPNAWKSGGILDFDSNASCMIDGLNQEDVYWTVPPPSGHYLVRVDAFSLCGEAQADWTVQAVLNGAVVGAASGSAHDSDTAFPHVAGAGVLALEFDVP
jgi:hypothetical protein